LARVVVLDASALIALVSSQDIHHEWALEMFKDTASFDLQMSALTQAEVMVHPAKAGKLQEFQKMISTIGLEITPVESEDSWKLASLRAKSSLKMPDAVVLYQAIQVKGTIATTDLKLAQAAQKLGVGVFHPKGVSGAQDKTTNRKLRT
jgi:predicted nucleic acid-binding protein